MVSPSDPSVLKRCDRRELRVKLDCRLERGGSQCASSHTNDPTRPRRGSSHTHTWPPRSPMNAEALSDVTTFMSTIEPRTMGGALPRPTHLSDSDARDHHRYVFAGWHDRFPRLLPLSEPVVQSARDEDHHEHGPDDRDLVQEVDLEVEQLLTRNVVIGLHGFRVREDPERIRAGAGIRVASGRGRRGCEEVQHHREPP